MRRQWLYALTFDRQHQPATVVNEAGAAIGVP
jgi:hypothetical protein